MSLFGKLDLLHQILTQEIHTVYQGRHVTLIDSETLLTPVLGSLHSVLKANLFKMQLTFKKRLTELLSLLETRASGFCEYLFQRGFVDTLRTVVGWERGARDKASEIQERIVEQLRWFKVNFRESLFHPENKLKLEALLEVRSRLILLMELLYMNLTSFIYYYYYCSELA